jgi:Zn-finger protein
MDVSKAWEYRHWNWIGEELKETGLKLSAENIPAIIDLMSFVNRSKKHPERCTLYSEINPCHRNITLEDFNCFICACPNYDTNTDQGSCRISSPLGKLTLHPNTSTGLILNCENCPRYHSTNSVRDYLVANIEYLRLRIEEATRVTQTEDYKEAIAKLEIKK